MKTETAAAPTLAGEVLDIDLDRIRLNPFNKPRPLDEAFLQSLRDKGQQVIALLRPYGEDYMVVFGARRFLGLKEIGAETLRAEVREMGDQEAEELCAVENAQRLGLTWRQQCELIEGYLKRHKDEDAPARIGSALGITTAQVRRRVKLLDLSPKWVKAIKQGDFPAWTVDHFEMLTVYTKEQQENLFDQLDYDGPAMSLKELREDLAREMRTLKSAPWGLDDETLIPKAGACTACPKRTGIENDLFDEPGAKVKKGDRCLDTACFVSKMQAHAEAKKAQLKEENPGLIEVRKEGWNDYEGALGTGSYKAAKKGDKGAVPAMVKETGALTYVKVTSDSASAKRTAAKAQNGGKVPLKDRKAALEKRRTLLVIAKLIDWVKAKDLEWPAEDFDLMVALLYVFGTDNQDTHKTTRYGWAGVHKWTKKAPTAGELWPRVQGVLVEQLRSQLYREKPSMVDAKEIAAIVSADLEAFRKAAEEEIPVPKSWATAGKGGKKGKGKKDKGAFGINMREPEDENLDGAGIDSRHDEE